MEHEHIGIKLSSPGKACQAHGGTFDVCVGHWASNLCCSSAEIFCQDFSPSYICSTLSEIQHVWWHDRIYLWNLAFVYDQTSVGIVGRKARNTTKVFKNYEPEPAVLSSPQFLRCDNFESQKPLSDCTLDMTQWVFFGKWRAIGVLVKEKCNWCYFTEGNPMSTPPFCFVFFFPWKLQNLLCCLCAERKWW